MDDYLSKITKVRDIILDNYDEYAILNENNIMKKMIVFTSKEDRYRDADGNVNLKEWCLGIKKEFSFGMKEEGWVKYEAHSQIIGWGVRTIGEVPRIYINDEDVLEYLNNDNFTEKDRADFWRKVDNIISTSK